MRSEFEFAQHAWICFRIENVIDCSHIRAVHCVHVRSDMRQKNIYPESIDFPDNSPTMEVYNYYGKLKSIPLPIKVHAISSVPRCLINFLHFYISALQRYLTSISRPLQWFGPSF